MKKSILISFLGLSALILSSCGSTKLAVEEYSPMAVISIIGNSSVPWVKDDPNDPDESEADGLLSNVVNKLIDKDNPEMVTAIDRLDYADESIRHLYSEIAGGEVLDKEKVVKSEAYEDLSASYFNLLSATKKATDYKDLTTIGSKNTRILLEKLGAKSAILLNFTFQKELAKGNKWNGNLYGLVNMKVKVLNSRGKQKLLKTYTAKSSQQIKISTHKYKKDELAESLKEPIDSCIRQFVMEFVGESEPVKGAQAESIALPVKDNAAEEGQSAEAAETTDTATNASAASAASATSAETTKAN